MKETILNVLTCYHTGRDDAERLAQKMNNRR